MTNAAIEKSKENTNADIQRAKQVQRISPAVDIYENEGELVFVADMPGVPRDGLDVQVEKMELTMTGKVNDNFQYERSFKLPATVDVDNVTAGLKSGVLTVTFKKAESAKPRKIKVSLLK